jgi:hypothetical protein
VLQVQIAADMQCNASAPVEKTFNPDEYERMRGLDVSATHRCCGQIRAAHEGKTVLPISREDRGAPPSLSLRGPIAFSRAKATQHPGSAVALARRSGYG